MLSYVIRRLFMAIPMLLGAMSLVFFAMRVLPGDPAKETIIIDSAALGIVDEGDIKAPPDVAYHAEVTRAVLANQPGPARATVVITAALLLCLSKRVADLAAGVECVNEVLASGAAQRLLQAWQT